MSKIKKNLWRHVLQIGVIALIVGFIVKVFFGGKPADVEAYCPLGGLESLATFLNSSTLACSMSIVQIMIGIVLAVGVILFSKLFCGYVCPLGTITEWLGVLRKKMKIKYEIPMGSVADKVLRVFKYIILFWIFYMTITTSELFCKNFDPYYAMATGFRGEITAWMTVISMLLLFLGSLFINMFWCKYICPLGALSNIFKFTLTFAVLVVLSLIVGAIGLSMPWVWLLGVACVICYIYEIVYYESKVFPLLRITKDETTCTNCGACSRKCPQQIDVKNMKVVKHVDCTLCGECIASCPEKSLNINRRSGLRWVPAILVVVLFFLALWMSQHWELPTIDERWGDEAKIERLESFERDGMRTVKCFGSSKAFANKMRTVPGVYGVTTYVNRFAVVIHYDPTETTKEKVEESMFTPTKRKLNTPPANVQQLKVVTMEVDKLFDRMDITFLGNIIKEKEGFYGIVSEYGCPVKVILYMDVNKPVDKKELQGIVETRKFEMPVHGGGVKEITCNYELTSVSEQVDTIGRQEFLDYMFPKTSSAFKGNKDKYDANVATAVYEMDYPGIDKPLIQRQLPYLGSFLSNNPGILAYETALRSDMSVIRITYVKDVLDDEKIWEYLQSPQWTIHFKDGTVKDMDPTLSFKQQGKTVE
ncbi:4Fe-4S binding protein [Butyricimonas hominis]|uniref:4Fe-4S binding protein n=1 Tax=Butyricimonas hominis TaxID=2763032 RepID=A0ABR7D6N6_9BACT|nr:4Fe-4S binding protein [Butyricimonas hominis]MBC5623611.1 4Fe-4S binding protein [Butyricimonas hominis]